MAGDNKHPSEASNNSILLRAVWRCVEKMLVNRSYFSPLNFFSIWEVSLMAIESVHMIPLWTQILCYNTVVMQHGFYYFWPGRLALEVTCLCSCPTQKMRQRNINWEGMYVSWKQTEILQIIQQAKETHARYLLGFCHKLESLQARDR